MDRPCAWSRTSQRGSEGPQSGFFLTMVRCVWVAFPCLVSDPSCLLQRWNLHGSHLWVLRLRERKLPKRRLLVHTRCFRFVSGRVAACARPRNRFRVSQSRTYAIRSFFPRLGSSCVRGFFEGLSRSNEQEQLRRRRHRLTRLILYVGTIFACADDLSGSSTTLHHQTDWTPRSTLHTRAGTHHHHLTTDPSARSPSCTNSFANSS